MNRVVQDTPHGIAVDKGTGTSHKVQPHPRMF